MVNFRTLYQLKKKPLPFSYNSPIPSLALSNY